MKEIYKRAHLSSRGLKVIMFNPISGYSIPPLYYLIILIRLTSTDPET